MPDMHVEVVIPAWEYKWRFFLDDNEAINDLQSGNEEDLGQDQTMWWLGNNTNTDEHDTTHKSTSRKYGVNSKSQGDWSRSYAHRKTERNGD